MALRLEALRRDLGYAARSLRRAPGFTGIALLCFAVGTGVNATMFAVVEALLFRAPPHVRDAANVFSLDLRYVVPGSTSNSDLGAGRLANSDYTALASESRMFDAAAYATRELTLGRGIGAKPVLATFATPSFFDVLGVEPYLGRLSLETGDALQAGASAVVLSFGLWQRQFGADSTVLGRTLRVGNGVYAISGIAPAGFHGVDHQAVDLWLPYQAGLHELYRDDMGQFRIAQWLNAIVRPRPGVTRAVAEADASRLFQLAYSRRFGTGFRGVLIATLEPIIRGYGDHLGGNEQVSLWLVGVSVIVLLIAVANVSNLYVARNAARRAEIAVRAALGASRLVLARQLFIESFTLAISGGLIGLILAWWGSGVIRRYFFPSLLTVGDMIDARVLGAAALVVTAAAVACALLPIRQALRSDVVSQLKLADNGTREQGVAVHIGVLAIQVALTMVLLVGAGLFAMSFRSLRSVDLGLDIENLVVGQLPLAEAGYSPGQSGLIMQDIRDRVRAIPGVESASLASTAPFVGSFSWPDFVVPGEERAVGGETDGPGLLELNDVSANFFATLHTRLLRGRTFSPAEEAGAQPVAIINKTMADALWPGGHAIGHCIRVGGMHRSARTAPCSAVIGVVNGTHVMDVREAPKWQYFAPRGRHDVDWGPILLIRTKRDPSGLMPVLRRTIQGAVPDLPYADLQTMRQIIAPQMRPWMLGTTMFTLFGVVALALAVCGLYGVFSYSVEQRRREIGIRVAVGARPADVARLVVRQALGTSAIGLGLGLLGAVAIGRALRSFMIGIPWLDGSVLGAAAVLIALTVAVAVYVPARRASRVDPTTLLRTE